MASIIPIKQPDGSQKWRATVRIKKDGVLILNRSKTFALKKLAADWAVRLEAQIQIDGAPDKVVAEASLSKITLAMLIGRYREEMTRKKPLGETKHYSLKIWEESALAQKPISKVTATDIIEFCEYRSTQGSGPATILQYIGYVHQVFAMAKPLWGLDLSPAIIDEVKPVLTLKGLMGQGNERDRRLEGDEYDRLLTWLSKYENTRSKGTSFASIFQFAVETAMRAGEICRITWSDVNYEKRTIIIRDRKDPKRKIGNHQTVPLLTAAWAILEAQPKIEGEDKIFPAVVGTVSSVFAQACEVLGIEDLTFHDMRHEATSRLFEMGYSIEQVALVTGHKNWNQLRRYTKLRPESLHRDLPKIEI